LGTADEQRYWLPQRYWAWALNRRVWVVLFWVGTFAIAAHHIEGGRSWLANEPDTAEPFRRPDSGGQGHTQIDFGGQWVMGRMIVKGYGQELYHRQRQWDVVRESYPRSAETPVQISETILPKKQWIHAKSDDDLGHDADRMMFWFMGKDQEEWKVVGGAAATPLAIDFLGNPFASAVRCQAAAAAVTPEVKKAVEEPAIGGPLYPPIHGFIYAPLALIDSPQTAYFLFLFLAVGFGILAGLGIAIVTGRRIWWPLASAAVLLYPGCRFGIELGQNPTLSLCIVAWGWVLAARRRDWAAGMVWGLFAFKPVWGMAFFLVPLLMGRWRMCVAMVGTGAGLAALTLPFVGLHSWFEWLSVGTEAAELYTRSLNWINLSRDLQGIPRRFLHDFDLPQKDRETMQAKVVAWTLWGVVFSATVLIYRFRADRRKCVGLGAAFLFLGAWLTCYRFMYYDVLLSIMGVACLAAEPWRLFQSRPFTFAANQSLPGAEPLASTQRFGPRRVGYVNSLPLTVLLLLYLHDNWFVRLAMEATFGVQSWSSDVTAPDGSMKTVLPRIHFTSSIYYAWDTALVLVLWVWCGWRLLLGDEPRAERSAPPRG